MSDLLGPSGNRMNTLSRLGLLFGATGAGLQGQLPQFQQSLMAQQDAIRQRLAQEKQQQNLMQLAQMGKFDQNAGTAINPLLGRASPQMAQSPQSKLGSMASTNPLVAQALATQNLQTMMGSGGFSGTLKPGETAFDKGRIVASMPAEAPRGPAKVQEYEYAKSQGFQGSMLDYERYLANMNKERKAPSNVVVNNGQQQVVLDTSTPQGQAQYTQLIGSGWATGEIKRPTQVDQKTAENAYRSGEQGLDALAQAVVDLKTSRGLPRITGMQSMVPNRPGSEAADAEAQLNKIKSKSAFAALQAMRDASKTGGALGSITEKELDLLQNNIASLDTRQSTDAFQAQLDGILEYVNNLKENMALGYANTFGTQVDSSITPMAVSSRRGSRVGAGWKGWSVEVVK
jgi:hypothetical protein